MDDELAREMGELRAEMRAAFARLEALILSRSAQEAPAGAPAAWPGPGEAGARRAVYTDGACSGNGQAASPGGWAYVFADGDEGSGGEPRTTNQRMELRAAIEALKRCAPGQDVELFSDSAYLVNCFRDRWHERWERSGWLTKQRQPVANQDLWKELLGLAGERSVSWRKVGGHSGDPLNDRADRLAVAAIPKADGRTGGREERGGRRELPEPGA